MRKLKNLMVVAFAPEETNPLGLWANRLGIEMTWAMDVDEAFDKAPKDPKGWACLVIDNVPDDDSLACLYAAYERVIIAVPDEEPQNLFILRAALLSQVVLNALLKG